MNRARAVAGLCLFFLEGCAAFPPGHLPVPPIRAEQVPAPPNSNVVLIWQPGHYDWTGAAYVWVPGSWVDRAGHGTLWQDGYWRQTQRESVWVPAHWI